MHYVMEALGGAADFDGGNRDNSVSLLEIYRYASAKTRREAAAHFGEFQTPAFWGELLGDFEFAAVPASFRPLLQAGPSVASSSTAGKPASGNQTLARLRSGLRILEAATNWSAVASAWHARRDAWISEVEGTGDFAAIVKLMWEFEQNLAWNSVGSKWREHGPIGLKAAVPHPPRLRQST